MGRYFMNGFEINMTLDDVTPITQRKLLIPSEITFEKLHETISLVFNLDRKSKYKFVFDDFDLEIKNTQRINRDNIDSRYEKIVKYFQAFNKAIYINNFWQINMEIKEIDYDKSFPQIVHSKGFYNPLPEIKSVNEFSNLIEKKMNIKEANTNELKLIDKLRRINKLKLQKKLMIMFKVPYKVSNRKIIEVKKENTLDTLFD